jgi:hypothetical protein
MSSRVALPEEFFDRTTDVVLRQPEPQYLYATWFKAALALSLATPDMIGLPGREIPSAGAQYTPAERDRLMLASPLLDMFAAKVDFNAAPGSSLRINRPLYADTTYTEASRRIATGATISTTPIKPGSEQANLTLFRYGGPYDQDNSRIAPYPVEAFDANMGVHKQASLVGTHLARDFDKFIEKVNVALLDLAANTIYPEGMTADNDAVGAGQYPFRYEMIPRAQEKADALSLPTLPDGFRCMVITETQERQLALDPMYQRVSQFFPQYSVLFPNYVGSCGKFHIFKNILLTKTANSSAVNIHKGHVIAPGAMLAGMGRRARVAQSTDDNYGETAKVIWLADLAFGIADNRFSISLRSSE